MINAYQAADITNIQHQLLFCKWDDGGGDGGGSMMFTYPNTETINKNNTANLCPTGSSQWWMPMMATMGGSGSGSTIGFIDPMMITLFDQIQATVYQFPRQVLDQNMGVPVHVNVIPFGDYFQLAGNFSSDNDDDGSRSVSSSKFSFIISFII